MCVCVDTNTIHIYAQQHSSHAIPLKIEFDFVVLNTYHTSSIDTHLFGFTWLYSLFCFTFASRFSPFSLTIFLCCVHVYVHVVPFLICFNFMLMLQYAPFKSCYMHIYVYNTIQSIQMRIHMVCLCLSLSSMLNVYVSISVVSISFHQFRVLTRSISLLLLISKT